MEFYTEQARKEKEKEEHQQEQQRKKLKKQRQQQQQQQQQQKQQKSHHHIMQQPQQQQHPISSRSTPARHIREAPARPVDVIPHNNHKHIDVQSFMEKLKMSQQVYSFCPL